MTSTPDQNVESAPTKRKRRWWRWPLRVFAIVFIAFAWWLGSWVYWAYTVEPNPTVDYAAKLEQLARDAQPEGENAWPLIEEAIAIYERMDEQFPEEGRPPWHRERIDLTVIYSPIDMEELARLDLDPDAKERTVDVAVEAVRWLRDQGVFESIASVAERPVVAPVEGHEVLLIATLAEYISVSQRLTIAALASMHMAAKDGDWDHATQAIEGALVLAATCAKQATSSEQLVGYANFAIIRTEIVNLALTSDLDTTQLRRMLRTIDKLTDFGDPRIALNGERYILLDLIQRAYSDDGHGDGYHIASAWGELDERPVSRIRNLQGPFRPSRSEVENMYNRIIDGIIEAAQVQVTDRHRKIAEVEAFKASLSPSLQPFTVFIPSIDRFVTRRDTALQHLESLRLFLAIELYRVENGSPPGALEQLVPDYLDSISPDPLTGEPFGYRLGEHEVARHGYVLYSFGRDGIDNDANFDPYNPDLAYRIGEGAGFDLMFNIVSTDLDS